MGWNPTNNSRDKDNLGKDKLSTTKCDYKLHGLSVGPHCEHEMMIVILERFFLPTPL